MADHQWGGIARHRQHHNRDTIGTQKQTTSGREEWASDTVTGLACCSPCRENRKQPLPPPPAQQQGRTSRAPSHAPQAGERTLASHPAPANALLQPVGGGPPPPRTHPPPHQPPDRPLTARSSPVSGCPAISPHPTSSPPPSQHQNECGGKRPEARGGDSPVTPQPQRRKHGDDGAPRRGRIPPHVICPMDGMKNVLTVCGGDEAPRGERKKGHPMPPEFHRSSQREHRQKRRPCARTRGGG